MFFTNPRTQSRILCNRLVLDYIVELKREWVEFFAFQFNPNLSSQWYWYEAEHLGPRGEPS